MESPAVVALFGEGQGMALVLAPGSEGSQRIVGIVDGLSEDGLEPVDALVARIMSASSVSWPVTVPRESPTNPGEIPSQP
jgi:hypothetical protein